MPSRTYQVNYDITANTMKAVQEFKNMFAPLKEMAEQAEIAKRNLLKLKNAGEEFKRTFSNLSIKPVIDTRSFADGLATMEANVKASSMRMRASLESALSGSLKDHRRINDLLGTNNWKAALSEQESDLKQLQQKIRLFNAIKDKFSRNESKRAAGDKVINDYKNANRNPYERAVREFKRVGLGNILHQNEKGEWAMAGGDSRTKLKDYIKTLETDAKDVQKTIDAARERNLKNFGNIASQTVFDKKAGFLERALGVSPEMLKEIQPTLNALSSLASGVQHVQDKVENVVKRTPISEPKKPNLATEETVKGWKKEIEEISNSNFPQESQIRAWENLKNQRGALSPKEEKILERLKNSRDAWLKTNPNIGEENAKRLQELKAKYADYKKQSEDYQKKLAAWKEKPYIETTEQVVTSANTAKKATAKPLKIDITGNFHKQLEPLKKLSEALSAIPKAPIDIAVNVNTPTGVVSNLESIKSNLQSIETLRGKLTSGSFKGLAKATSAVNTAKEKATKNGAKETISVKANIDTTTTNADFKSVISNLKKYAAENTLSIKAKIDYGKTSSELRTKISNLKKTIKSSPLVINAKVDTAGIKKNLRSIISSLKKTSKSSNISIKTKIDTTGNSKKLRDSIKALKTVASKNFVTIKSKFDTSTVTNDLKKTLASLSKTTMKGTPTIKVNLDINEATSQLNKLLTKIKSASPQTIKVEAVTSQKTSSTRPTSPRSSGTLNSATTSPISSSERNIRDTMSGYVGGRMSRVASKPGFVDRMRKSLYPLTGNVSLGASTPVALDMAKGMGIMYGVGGAMNMVTGGLTEAMEYQNTMETAKAILKNGYAGKNFDRDYNSMAKEVRSVAKRTKFTAPEAADATRFMAMAGLKIPDIKASVSPIADVAVIGDNDFGEVADKITNIQTAFKMKPWQMRHMADALTNTFTKTNTDMMMLAESMQYAAPMAHMAGMDLNDTLAMIGIMGNSGIQASMAGTTLRMMMQNTLNPNKKQAALWKKLGVATRDKDGNLRNMIDILSDVEDATISKKLPMADVVSNLFRVTASAGAGSLMENIGSVKKLAEENRMANGISSQVSAEKQNTVKGLWAQMTSSFTEANLKVFEQFQDDIKDMIKSVRDYFSSREAVENLKQAFSLIKDLMNMFGTIAKGWMWAYNKFGWLAKGVIWTQMFATQIGLMIKPIMSLVNVFGGLKSMVVGVTSALTGGSNLKKVAVAASIAGAAINGASANTSSNIASDYVSRHTALKEVVPSAQTAAYLSAYTPYSVYSSKMEELKKKRMFYEIKGNRLKNSIQKPGSLVREAVNPFLFAGFSSFNPANKEDVKHLNEMIKNRNAMSLIYAAHPYQRSMMRRAYSKMAAIDSEMASLTADNVMRHKKLAQARTYNQLNNIGLLRRYARMNPGVDNEATKRYEEYRKLRREEQISNLALMSRFRYSSFYHKNNIPEADNFFVRRKSELMLNSSLRRAKQLENNELMYRASKLNGNIGGAIKYSWKRGFANTLAIGSMADSLKGFWTSIRSGFISVLSSVTRGAGAALSALLSPLGAFTLAIGAAGAAAWGIYKEWKKIKKEKAQNTANSNQIKKQAASFINGYNKNVSNVEKGVKLYNGRREVLQNISDTRRVLRSHNSSVLMNTFAQNFSAINSITGKMSDTNKAKLIFDKYIEPNFELSGAGGKFYSNVIRNTFKNNLDRQIIKSAADDVAKSGGFAPGAHLHGDNGIDLSWVKKQAAISQLYRAGASSQEAMDARKQIFEIFRNAKNLKDAKSQARTLINKLFGANSIQAIGEKDASYSTYSEIVNNKNIDQFKQYRWGAQQSLYNWINNPEGSKLMYFKGILELKEKLSAYSSSWYDAISGIMSNMGLLFRDTKGKIHKLNLQFTKNGVPLWNTLYEQLSKLHIDFGNSFKNHLNILTDIVGQMNNIPELSEYIKEIGGVREFLIRQIQKMNDLKKLTSWDGDKFESNLPKFNGTGQFSGPNSDSEYQKYVDSFKKKNGIFAKPLTKEEWKKQNSYPKPFYEDGRKEASKIADAQIETNSRLKKLDNINKWVTKFSNAVTGGGPGGRYTSPLADDAKNVNSHIGNGNKYGGVNARPTQINITVDKLANFDKFQFLEGREKDIVNLVADAVAEAWANISVQAAALASNDKRDMA